MSNDEIIIVRETPPGVEKQVDEIIIERGAGVGPAGDDAPSDHTLLSNIGVNTHAQIDSHIESEANPHKVTFDQVPEGIFNNGIILGDTVIDLNNGPVQALTMGAIAELSVTGWEAIAPVGEDKVQAATLIIIDGDLFAPTFEAANQGNLPTYIAKFANVQELASLGPDGEIYNMGQFINDQHVLLGSEIWDGSVTLGDGWTDDGGGVYTCDGSQVASSILALVGATIRDGKDFVIKFTLSDRTAGQVREILGASVTQGFVSANDDYLYSNIENDAANFFIFQADVDFAGTLSLISLKEMF